MDAMLKIGASKESVIEARDSLLAIIKQCDDSKLDNETIRCVLDTYKNICSVSGTTISNCNFMGGVDASTSK